jgi:hypothetical protein
MNFHFHFILFGTPAQLRVAIVAGRAESEKG